VGAVAMLLTRFFSTKLLLVAAPTNATDRRLTLRETRCYAAFHQRAIPRFKCGGNGAAHEPATNHPVSACARFRSAYAGGKFDSREMTLCPTH
jgi:hypothetical protein